jgi:FAD/FMN-containing dehydrogenase
MTAEATRSPAEVLRAQCSAVVHVPGEPGYEAARLPWNVAVDQRPAAVAEPTTTAEVAEVVVAARRAGLRVAPQSTGHSAGPLAAQDLGDVVLLRAGGLDQVEVDVERSVVRVGGGSVWLPVVEAAAAHGLGVLHGSSPDVGVVGYTLGGGVSFYSRKLGLAASSLVSAELVLADGSVVRASETEHADLFWAVRGGGGNFGIITELELRAFPIADVFAGFLLFDATVDGLADRVVRRWAEWTLTAPDEVTTSLRLLSLPPLPELPPFLRGRRLVVIDGAVLDTDERAAEILAPLRELGPELDTFTRVPAGSLVRLHMDPEGPTPSVSDAALLDALPDDAIDVLLAAAGPASGSRLLAAELRQLGGALSRPHPDGGALSRLDGQYALLAVAVAATPELGAAGLADARRLTAALAPWTSPRPHLNFLEAPADVRAAFDDDVWSVLTAIRSSVDPDGVLVANHRIG